MKTLQHEEYQTVKRQLSAVQLEIKHALTESSLPKNEDVKLFVELSEKMKDLSLPAWQAAVQVYMDKLELFQSAFQAKEITGTKDAFAGLMEGKAAGHAEFRKK
jgi:XXXCH domain-containing protein